MELREASAEDLPALAALLVAAGRAAWGHIGPVERMEPPRLELADWGAVAIEGNEVLGFSFTRGCEVELLHVHPRAWGRGAGRALLLAAEESLRAAGCSEAFLFTEERNSRALELYSRAGWRADGVVREREWLGVPIREPRLVKRLP